MTPEELDEMLKEAEEKLEAFDAVDAIKEKVIDAIQDKVLTKAAKIAAKKPIQAVLGPLGWAWAAYDIIDGALDVNELMDYLDEVKKEVARLKEDMLKFRDKMKEIRTAIKNGNVDKASAVMADMQQNIALLDACTRARKCMLVPYNDTAKRTQGNEKNNKGCCPGQTGHHPIPDAYMKKKTICSGYSKSSAPTVCVEGTNQSHGSHGDIHRETEIAIQDDVDGKSVEYEDARDAAIEAHKKSFPLSMCSDKCLKAQLDNYYHEKCKNQSGFFGGDPNPALVYCKICPVDNTDKDQEL